MLMNENAIIVRVRSHRARNKLKAGLSRLPQGYYSFEFPGEFREVTEAEWKKLQGVKGLSRARVDRSKLRKYLPV